MFRRLSTGSRLALIGAAIGSALAVLVAASEELNPRLLVLLIFPLIGALLGSLFHNTARTFRDLRRNRMRVDRSAVRASPPGPLEFAGGAFGLVAGAATGLQDSVGEGIGFALVVGLFGVPFGAVLSALLPWEWAKPGVLDIPFTGAVISIVAALGLTIAGAVAGSSQLAILPFFGAVLGLIAASLASDVVGEVLKEPPTGRSTRRHALGLNVDPSAVPAGETVSVQVRLRGYGGGARPRVSLVRRTTQTVIGSGGGLEEREGEVIAFDGEAAPAGADRYAISVPVPDDMMPSLATGVLLVEWVVRAALHVAGNRDPRVQTPLEVLAPPVDWVMERSFGSESWLDLSVDGPVTPGSALAGHVGLASEVASVRKLGVALIREVAVPGGPGAEEIVAGPVTLDPEGRFVIEVPADASGSPTARGDAGSVAWYVMAEADLKGRRNCWAKQEVSVKSRPAVREPTVVGFPPSSRRFSLAGLAIAVAGLAFAAFLFFLESEAEEEPYRPPPYTAPAPETFTVPDYSTDPMAPTLPEPEDQIQIPTVPMAPTLPEPQDQIPQATP